MQISLGWKKMQKLKPTDSYRLPGKFAMGPEFLKKSTTLILSGFVWNLF